MNLKFVRRLSRSEDNKASVITIPRPIAQAWEQYESVTLTFDGTSLVIRPIDKRERVLGDDSA